MMENEIPRWAFERVEKERAQHYKVKPNPANVDVIMNDAAGYSIYHMFAAYIADAHKPALSIIKEQLSRQVGCEQGWRNPDFFDPWEAFPSVYGSYSSDFDDMAIVVLDNILNRRWGADHGEGLAHEMFRELLCTAGLCDYGTSPRGCFPEPGFAEVLPALLDKWREYRRVEWGDD